MLKALLVDFDGRAKEEALSEWNTASFAHDPARVEYHLKKMKSKDERPAMQMGLLGIKAGKVQHITIAIQLNQS